MAFIKLITVFFSSGFVLGMAGCVSTTQLVESWYDENADQASQLENTLVLGVFEQDLQRRMFESSFVNQLKAMGNNAVAGYTLMPQPSDYDQKEDIIEAVKSSGVDSVLITRFESKADVERKVPPTVDYVPSPVISPYDRFGPYYHSYYDRAYQAVYVPGYTVNDTVVQLETVVYSAATEKLIWAGKSKSTNAPSGEKIASDLARIVTDSMKSGGLLQ